MTKAHKVYALRSDIEDLTGRRFGRWEVLALVGRGPRRTGVLWKCRCVCGKEKTVSAKTLKDGASTSCGCARWVDLTGQTFGRWEVLHRDFTKTTTNVGGCYFICRCACGVTKSVRGHSLTQGDTQGCRRCSKWRGQGEISGYYWAAIKANAERRGLPFFITMAEAWMLFVKQQARCALSGLPLHLARRNGRTASLDRIRSDKGYVPGNIQWVHKDINRMKWAHTEEHFLELCRLVARHTKRRKS